MKPAAHWKIMIDSVPGCLQKTDLQIKPEIPGLIYRPDYITNEQEAELISIIDTQPWITDLKRRVQHYGYRYDYKARNVSQSLQLGPLPDWVSAYCQQLQSNGLFQNIPDQVIINEYQPGQGIASHIDCIPCFEDTIASLSLGSACIMDFTDSEANKVPLLLETRSLVILSGDARYHWRHSIAHRKTDSYRGSSFLRGRRLSLTFRNVIRS
jgi:alkylated DNA repair dioxygenase AlkB